MTDTLIDDEIVEVRSTNRPATSTLSSTSRRPMYIETEVRTDTVTTRRMASAAANRSVQDLLENTKSPLQDRQSTSYSYAPNSRTTAYDNHSVTSRQAAQGNQPAGFVSTIKSVLSQPSQIISSVQDQLINSYENVKDRVGQLFAGQTDSTGGNSPTRGVTSGGTRYSRTSSQSSQSSGRSKGYNLRSRPVHSTPRDTDSDHGASRKGSKSHKSYQQNSDSDEEYDEEQGRLKYYFKKYVQLVKRLFRTPLNIFDFIWDKVKLVPLWLLIPLVLLLGLYLLPPLSCRPFERFLHPKVNDYCKTATKSANTFRDNSYDFTRRHTYVRGVRNLKQFYGTFTDLKNSITSSLNDVYNSLKSSLSGGVGGVKNRVADVVETTAENAKEYYDAGIEKVNNLIEELKQEREKLLGARHTLNPAQEKELGDIVRKYIDEYAADETGQADFALEANGGKVVETRCQEYTDEPRQNVVKFFGIPIVHMSKQPDIIIKPGRMPGQCFPFKGNHGSVIIRLAVPVVPTEFVLEHLAKSISIVGHINSAPNNFTVYALKDKHDKEGVVLGRYYYDAENGSSLQRFKPQLANVPVVEYIEVQVTSNWGNPNYTCLYRFRVHGDMQTVAPTAA